MSHTPGPWKILYGGFPSDDGFGISSDNAAAERVKLVAECWPCSIVDQEHRLELLANGRLIAAAPDLLAACKAAWDYIDEMAPICGEGEPSAIDVLNLINSAIDRAEISPEEPRP